MQKTAFLACFLGIVDGFESAGLAFEVENGEVGVVGTHHVATAAAEVDAEDTDGL